MLAEPGIDRAATAIYTFAPHATAGRDVVAAVPAGTARAEGAPSTHTHRGGTSAGDSLGIADPMRRREGMAVLAAAAYHRSEYPRRTCDQDPSRRSPPASSSSV